MKSYLLLIPLLISVLTGIQYQADAQNAPVTTCATVSDAVPGMIQVPVTVTGFTNIGAVSLTLDYDYWVLHFEGWTPNPQIGSFLVGDFNMGNGIHRLNMGWYGQATSLAGGSTLVTLNFTYFEGNTVLSWYDDGPSCEFADGQYNILNDIPTEDYYINGYVCGAVGVPGPVTGNNSVCRGQAGEVYGIDPVINAVAYTWSVPSGAIIVTGQGTNSITVDFPDDAVSGMVGVFAVNLCGNGASAELPVTVNELPYAFAGNDTTINYGTAITLHAADGGSGSYAYHWSPGDLLIDPDVQDPQTVIMTLTTPFTVLVTNQTTLCQDTDEMVVTITGGALSINPVAVPPIICNGGYAQLISDAGGGSGNYSYEWSCIPPGSPPWGSTEANPVVSPDESKEYLLEVFDGFTTVSGSTGLTVHPLPSAVISGGDTLCGTGNTTDLTVDLTGVPPWSFIYSNSLITFNVYNLYTTPYIITTGEAGTYTILAVEDVNCSGTGSGSATVNVFPLPPKPEISVSGYELQSSSCCGNQWYMNGELIPGATSQFYTVTESGSYFVVVTLLGCSSEPSEEVDITVGIAETGAGGMSIYPNPAHDLVVIRTSYSFTGPLYVRLYTLDGRLVKSAFFGNVVAKNNNVLELKAVKPGLYIIQAITDANVVVRKIEVR